MQRYLANYFGFISLRKELLAGLTTFLTMSYIVIVNPLLLKDTGMDPGAVFVATCLIAAVASVFMGLYANYPIALAPGLGIAIYFSFVVVGKLGYSWQLGLGMVAIAAVLFLLVSVLKWRTYIIEAIPESLKVGITCGIGLFIGVIALKNAGIVAIEQGKWLHLAQPLALPALLTYLGVGFILVLQRLRIPGAILLTILILTIVATLCHLTQYQGLFSLPPSIKPTVFALRLPDLLLPEHWGVILSIFFVAFFDATGTLLGLLYQAGIPTNTHDARFGRALSVDSGAALVGACLGTATVGAYIENAAGIVAGGRTGLTAIVVGLLFLLTLFLAPLAQTIPSFATAAALLYVAYLMLTNIRHINWQDPAAAISAMITLVMMPLAFSIVDGIACGFIAYLLIRLIQRQAQDLTSWQWVLGALFAVYLVIQLFF